MVSPRVAFGTFLLIFVIVGGSLSLAYSTSEESTLDIEFSSADSSPQPSITDEPNSDGTTPEAVLTTDTNDPDQCRELTIYPMAATGKPGGNVEFRCHCQRLNTSLDSFPEWRGVLNVLHSHEQRIVVSMTEFVNNKSAIYYVTTLRLLNVSQSTPRSFQCADINSKKSRVAKLELTHLAHGGACMVNADCYRFLRCEDSKCSCPFSRPIFIPGSSSRCYQESGISQRCNFNQQCAARNVNSYCHSEKNEIILSGLCLCKSGFVAENEQCIQKGSTTVYRFYYMRRNQVLWWLLFALIPILICITVYRLIMLRRKAPRRERLFNVGSEQELAQPEKPPLRF